MKEQIEGKQSFGIQLVDVKLNKNDLDKIFNSVGLEVDYNNTEGMRYPIDPLENGILVRCVVGKWLEKATETTRLAQ